MAGDVMSDFAKAPLDTCPKCGRRNAFADGDPRYRPADTYSTDRLEWACSRCGYEVTTRTADAKVEVKP